MYNIVCMKKELIYIDLNPIYTGSNIFKDEYVLILEEKNVRKAILLYYPRMRFNRKLKHYKKINWN